MHSPHTMSHTPTILPFFKQFMGLIGFCLSFGDVCHVSDQLKCILAKYD